MAPGASGWPGPGGRAVGGRLPAQILGEPAGAPPDRHAGARRESQGPAGAPRQGRGTQGGPAWESQGPAQTPPGGHNAGAPAARSLRGLRGHMGGRAGPGCPRSLRDGSTARRARGGLAAPGVSGARGSSARRARGGGSPGSVSPQGGAGPSTPAGCWAGSTPPSFSPQGLLFLPAEGVCVLPTPAGASYCSVPPSPASFPVRWDLFRGETAGLPHSQSGPSTHTGPAELPRHGLSGAREGTAPADAPHSGARAEGADQCPSVP